MSNTALSENGKTTALGEMLPIDPFRSLYVHFGMLLGVEDFRTLDAYHRGKMWFHSSWLHRQGTIWGLGVALDGERSEVRVEPGAALDELGRELLLHRAACLSLGAWYQEHKDDPELAEIVEVNEDTGAVTFSAHVVIQFRACLERQVPAMTEPCDGSSATTAYSRVAETVELHLLPGPAPEWRSEPGQLPFHRLRLLFGLEEALVDEEDTVIDSDQDVLDARAEIEALSPEQRPAARLQWLRHFAALDEMEQSPAPVDEGERLSLFPAADPNPIPLANLSDITLLPSEDGWALDPETLTPNRVDNGIRPVHIPTTTIQELLCGPATTGAMAAVAPAEPGPAVADAGGPRVEPDSVEVDGEFIRFTVQGGPLMKASVDSRALSVSAFDNRDGWITAEIKKVTYEESDGRIEIELRDAPGGNLVRLIVRGTGPQPMMGRNRLPLAGAVGGPAADKMNGNDFVSMVRIRS
ncbi:MULTISPECIES: hypothetical protein [unclassified Microbulbifer]|uniref:hypothetical protein n=1 Tax=unclassified Microbulbifer TaxID=2619833 RepID=UPI0027E51BEA|nr:MULTISPECIES: hypothetical protein [unclassified Microbulbifer]